MPVVEHRKPLVFIGVIDPEVALGPSHGRIEVLQFRIQGLVLLLAEGKWAGLGLEGGVWVFDEGRALLKEGCDYPPLLGDLSISKLMDTHVIRVRFRVENICTH